MTLRASILATLAAALVLSLTFIPATAAIGKTVVTMGYPSGPDRLLAMVDDNEATLKYFRREGSMVRLDPANRSYQPQRYAPNQVRVQGLLAGLLRRY